MIPRRIHDRVAATARSIQRSWNLLGDPAALSLLVPLAYLPVTFIGPVFIDRQRLGGSVLQWIIVGLAGQLTLMVCFVVAGAMLSRVPQRARPAATLAAFALAAACRGLVLVSVSSRFGFAGPIELRYRLISGLSIHAAILVCLAILVVSREQDRRLIRALREREADLVDVDDSLQTRLSVMQETLTTQVRASLDRGLRDLDAALDRVVESGDTQPAINQLRGLVDEQVRPLSLTLATEPRSFDALPRARATTLNVPVRLPTRLGLRHSLQPLAMALVFTFGALSTAVIELNVRGILIFASACFIFVFALTSFMRWCCRWWVPPIGITFLATAMITSAIGALMPVTLQALGIVTPRFILVPSIVVGAVVGLATTGLTAFTDRGELTQALLAEAVDRLSQRVSILQQGEWLFRRRLSHLLHGSLQSAIQRGILRLGESPEPTNKDIQAVRVDIVAALSDLDQARRPGPGPEAVLQDLAVVWEGTCALSWEIEPAARDFLLAPAISADSCAEVVSECVGNAIWHGRSTQVVVTIRLLDSTLGSRLIVHVRDNGVGVSDDAHRGLGSLLLDSLCLRWERHGHPEGTVVIAEIALPEPAEGLGDSVP